MLDNFIAFLKGLIWGVIMMVALFIVIAIFDGWNPYGQFYRHASSFLAWCLVLCFATGVVNASSTDGFGVLNLILFILSLIGLYICSIVALVELDETLNGFYGAITCGLLGTSGALALFWYIIIGSGSADNAIQLMPTIIVSAVVMVIIGFIWGASVTWAKVVSIALGVIGPLGVLFLRIKNGSALDY